MIKKISFIIAMSLVLTGCSMFSKEEVPEDIPSDLLTEESVADTGAEMSTDDFGNTMEAVDGMLSSAADSLDVMASDAAGLMTDIGNALGTGETEAGVQPFNDAQQQQVSQVQNNYVRPPQNYMDVRLNYVLDARKIPKWKVADLMLVGQGYNTSYNQSTEQQTEQVATTLSPKVQEVWQKCRTDGTVSGTDLRDMLSALVVDKRALLLQNNNSTGEDIYYNFGGLLAVELTDGVPSKHGDEKAENLAGSAVKVYTVDVRQCAVKPDGKDYRIGGLYTENGLIVVNEEISPTRQDGSNAVIVETDKYSLEEIRDSSKESLTIGFIATKVE